MARRDNHATGVYGGVQFQDGRIIDSARYASDEQIRSAHANYAQGRRDAQAVAGEREYHRRKFRARQVVPR